MFKKIMILMLITLTAACNGAEGKIDIWKPASLDMRAPEGPYEYKKGWTDGCVSGVAATNNKVNMFLGTHNFTLDSQMKRNPLYFTAWRYGYNHCAYSMKTMSQYKYL